MQYTASPRSLEFLTYVNSLICLFLKVPFFCFSLLSSHPMLPFSFTVAYLPGFEYINVEWKAGISVKRNVFRFYEQLLPGAYFVEIQRIVY